MIIRFHNLTFASYRLMTVIEVKCHHFLSILMNILESAGKKALHNHVGEKNDLKKYETTQPG